MREVGDRGRSRQGEFNRSPESAGRDAQAAKLRAQGKSYQDIAETLGWYDKSGARKAVQRALVAVVQEAGDELRVLEIERLNDLLERAYRVMDTVHYAHSAGRLIEMDGHALVDSAPVLQAMDRVLKIMERRAKLLGLDAPTRIEHLTRDLIEAEIERLERELAAAAVADRGHADQAPPAEAAARPEGSPAG